MTADATDKRLLGIVERIERLMAERKGIADDIKDVFSEAKAVGYDAAQIRRLIARRAQRPDDRREADVLQAVYEAAVGMGDGEGLPSLADLRPDAAALACAMLTADIVGLEDPEQAAALVAHVLTLLDLRREMAELRAQASLQRAQAKEQGFDAKQLSATVAWFEKVAKHGEDAMRLGEATFHLYRGTLEAAQVAAEAGTGPVTQDQKLSALFAAPRPKKSTKKQSKLAQLRALARAEQRATGE